ncbi:hypothetical protein O6H91_05G044200 [Diphasiastrum complanatum]|uniref:Uncharacterized protein n=2 Tax=Diphasiastrum complanatum TaxID=34168 RepID=A0ACC2DMN5_DIPCM|nr:hypothetical protein O6H91_05G042800 [Diphasiastrum complanatum]KAJ7555554.1 hypothetical protein O6H91_05G044200 [Diphasiastrum complanatum]
MAKVTHSCCDKKGILTVDARKRKATQEIPMDNFKRELLEPLYAQRDQLKEEMMDLKELSVDNVPTRPQAHEEFVEADQIIQELKDEINMMERQKEVAKTPIVLTTILNCSRVDSHQQYLTAIVKND